MKDLKFARIATTTAVLGGIVALVESQVKSKSLKGVLNYLFTLLGTERQTAQYGIHMGPGQPHDTADDIMSDQTHNLEAVYLGKKTYNYYSFFANWVQLAREAFKHLGKFSSTFSLLHKAFDAFDGIIMARVASLFWNIRRISMALIPYSEKKMTSKQVSSEHEKIQRAFSSFINLSVRSLHKNPILSYILNNFKQLGIDKESVEKKLAREGNERISELSVFALKSWWKNIGTLFTGKYQSQGREYKIGDQDQATLPLYARSRLLSKILGFPMGIIATALNITSGSIGTVGRLFNNVWGLDSIGAKLADFANFFQTTMYATSEIPGHLHKIIQDIKRNGSFGWGTKRGHSNIKSLAIFSSGVTMAAMVFMRPFLNNKLFNRMQLQLARFFWSANRLKVHSDEYKEKVKVALNSEIEEAEKLNKKSPLEILLRVLFRDPEFSYDQKTEEIN